MTIHLLRHFKVQDETKRWLNSEEFNQWVDAYDTLPLNVIDVDLPKEIELIYCSSLSRAKRTVYELSNRKIIYSDKLIEVKSRVFFDTKIKLYKYAWFMLGGIMWYFNQLDGENRVDSQQRAKELIAELKTLKQTNILLVSHGFFMRVLVKELKSQGFRGEIDSKPMNGKLYTFSSSKTLATNPLTKS